MTCEILQQHPEGLKIYRDFKKPASFYIETEFNDTIPTYNEFISNKKIKDVFGIIHISKVKDEIGVSFPKEISNQQLINLKKAVSKTNDKIKDFVYLLFNVKQRGQADLYTWGLRKVKGNLDIQAKLDRAIQQATNTIQSNNKIKDLQDRVNKDRIQGSLFGLDTQNQENLEFHINTLNVVGQFLENVGIEQRLVPEFLSQNGNVVEGAIAAANFIQGTVDIIDDVEKRPSAWNKLPEEAAHWWYRLLDKNSELKEALLTSALTDRKEEELRNSLYGKTYNGVKVIGKLALDSNGNVTSKPALSAIREEAIGQLIAEAIKRIETNNNSPADYSFFKKFLEWINSIIGIFKNTTQDPFEVAAMKILSSDMSDLMTWEEYRKLNNIVNFADILTEQSVAPIDYTLIEDIGFIGSTFMEDTEGNATSGYRFHFRDSDWIKKYGDSSPSFYTQEELDNWVSANIKEHNQRQKQILQEVRDNQVFFDRLLNKSFRKKSKYLPKTLRKYFQIIDAQNLKPLREWNISQELQQITKKLSDFEKKQIIETNGYTNIAPTLKVLPDLLQKYGRKTTPEIIKQEIEITNKLVKKEITKEQATELRQKLENKKKGNPIVLSEPIKIDGAKKQELSILNGIKEMIKLENSNLKSITAEEFVNEAHNWLQTNYLLGFANENSYLSYRTDQTFQYLSDRQTNEDVDITNLTEEEIQRLPFEERQRIANIVGLTKQNPDVYHNKVSLRFNDMYHLKSGHFDKSPSAWGNLTYFYTGKNKWKDAVLLHEIQNDNIEFLREFKAEKVDLETSLGRYLQQLNTDLLDNITQIESGGKRIQKTYYNVQPKQHLQLNYQLQQLVNQPLEQGLQQLKQNLNEKIELYKSDNSVRNNPEKAQEAVEKAYSQRRKFADFQKRGGIKSLLSEQELKEIKDWVIYSNSESEDLRSAKQGFKQNVHEIITKLNRKVDELYGKDFPIITLEAPAKPLPKSQRNSRLVRRGNEMIRIGNASQELNENVNFLIAFSEQQINKQLSKNIEESKRNYIQARNATNAYNFNVRLAKITQEQYNNLIENYKYNQDLLNRLIDEQAQKDIQKESNLDSKVKIELSKIKENVLGFWGIPGEYNDNGTVQQFNTKEEAETFIKNKYSVSYNKSKQQAKFEALKQKALDKKAELEKNYGKIEEEVKQTLEIEMNYFTPLVHHLIQKHINQYGKDFPMYFSGYNITKLTQGNDRTALIYAGKDEINIVDKNSFEFNGKKYQKLGEGAVINAGTKEELRYFKLYDEYKVEDKDEIRNVTEQEFNKAIQEYEKAYQQATERRAKEIKYTAARQIGLLQDLDDSNGVTDKLLEEGIKKLNEYKKKSKQNLDRVVNTIMNISNNNPIETGAIYNAMSQISGVKLIWQDKIDGLKGNPGGYLVDLTNYNYNVPILYGLESKKQNNQKSPTSETNNNNLQEGLQWLKQIMPDVDPILVDGLIDNIANGSYDILNDLITLSKDFANKQVIKEEAFHRVFNLLPKSEQEELLDEGSKKYGIARGKSTDQQGIQGTLFQNTTDTTSPFEKMTYEEQQSFEKTIRDLSARISDRIGIPYEIINRKDQLFKGKIENDVAIINLAYCTKDTIFHEIAGHSIIRAIKNRTEFKNLDNFIEAGPYNYGTKENPKFQYELGFINDNFLQEKVKYLFDKKYDEEYNEEYYVKEFTSEKDAIDFAKKLKNELSKFNNLYQNLLKELETGKGKEVLDRIKRDYVYKENLNNKIEEYAQGYNKPSKYAFKPILGKEKALFTSPLFNSKQEAINWYYEQGYSDYTLEEQQEEAIVELLGMLTAEKLDNVKDGKLISLLKRLLKEIKAFVKDLLKQREIEIDKLPDNMTINDLADLLAYSNSKLILPGYEVEYTTPDNMKFKTYQEASNHISQLAKNVEDVNFSNISLNKQLTNEELNEIIELEQEIKDIEEKLLRLEKEKSGNYNYEKNIQNVKNKIKEAYTRTDYYDEYEKEDTIYNLEVELYSLEQDKDRNIPEEINNLISDKEVVLKNIEFIKNNNPLKNFIEKNKEYELSKEIIEEWKKVNNIQYNPEEIYSRGQEFVSVVGAYSSFDVNLMMQNLLSHIEDNEKAGGKFAISAYTKPVDRTIGHLEGGGGKIKFKIYPQSKDILWAANTDVYSGSVWDASEKVNKDKKSELLGVSYTKYPSLKNVDAVQPNLASIVDDLSHHHNELAISLNFNNFEIEVDEDVPYQTKKIIENINKILQQKRLEEISNFINKLEKEC